MSQILLNAMFDIGRLPGASMTLSSEQCATLARYIGRLETAAAINNMKKGGDDGFLAMTEWPPKAPTPAADALVAQIDHELTEIFTEHLAPLYRRV